MIKILFFILCLFTAFKVQAQTPVEIYAKGDKYDSLQAYKASKEAFPSGESLPKPVALNTQQEDFVRSQAQKLGVKVDINKVKTVEIPPSLLSGPTEHKLYVLGVEKGVVGALEDFYQAWGLSPDLHWETLLLSSTPISPNQMEEAIRKAVTASGSPKFLISQPGKMRIMTLSEDDKDVLLDY